MRVEHNAQIAVRRRELDGRRTRARGVNRQRDRVKLLYWDQDGLAIWYKRLERGTFALPQVDEETIGVTLSATDLAILLGGVDLKNVRKRNRYKILASA